MNLNSLEIGTQLLPFLINFVVILILSRYVYYPYRRQKDYFFTYISVGNIVFLLSHILSNVRLELGFALGLFAIFGILRYRTDILPIKEMTYLFVVIGLSVINALTNFDEQLLIVCFSNLFVLVSSYFLESKWMHNKSEVKFVEFEKINLVHAEKETLLKEEIEKRTGWSVQNITIERVDFVRDTIKLKVEIIPLNLD